VSAEEPDGDTARHRLQVDRAGVDLVLEHERAHGREPQEQAHENPGFDVISRDDNGRVRYIEVKSLSSSWGTRNAAGLTRVQYETARKRGDRFWLYVVERATSDDPQVYCIQDPANQVNQYLFDDGWEALAETVEARRS
jgi:hypothetical protein